MTPVLPPRAELLALLDAVKDFPDDDTPRLVLADWLDDQDNALDAERAKFIREDIAAPQKSAWERKYQLPTGAGTRSKLWQQWLGPLASIDGGFERGLPLLWCEVTRLLEPDAPGLLASEEFAFVQRVCVTEINSPRADALIAMPEFRYVSGLCLFPPCWTLDTEESARFFASPNLAGLRWLEKIAGMSPGVPGLRALASNPALARLRVLSLPQCRLSDSAVVALARGRHLTKLESLDLSSNSIGDTGADALAKSDALTNLRVLDLQHNPHITANARRRLRNKFGKRVKL